jgi:hypothetical protein
MLEVMARKQAYFCSCGGDGGADTTKAWTRLGQGVDGARPAQARQGQCNYCVTTEVTRERKIARQGRP